MKTKLFLAAMAAVAVIGCQKEPAGSISAPDGDASFLKVDLRAAGTLTRAEVGTYEYGLADENEVKSIHFYFFDSEDKAYAVDNAQSNYVAAHTNVDWKTQEGSPYPNVAEISDAVLVIKQSKQAPPAKMVVVLNAPAFSVTNLAGLHQAIDYYSTENGFVMSNSVYFDGSAIVDATSIMSENIFAANNFTDVNGNDIPVGSVIPNTQVKVGDDIITVKPVEVYVERVAAKVRVSGGVSSEGQVNLASIPVMDKDGKQATFGTIPVYAKVLGWQVTNNTAKAPLLKDINASWTEEGLGFAWNAPSNFRSYWAATTDEPKHDFTFADVKGHNVAYDYYFENTAIAKADNGVDVGTTNGNTTANQASQLLIAAQLVDGSGNPLQIAKWYGVQYTIEDLKAAMVATVSSKIYVKKGEAYVTITKEDVDFYQVDDETTDNRYEVRVRPLSNTTYYNSSVVEANAEAKALLEGIDPAQMWADGHTYYYTTIKHFGAVGTTGEYGIVRNHVYDIKIDGITGFGTPVYKENEIITPEKPEEDVALNLSARINILAWHLVSQNVTLN